MSVPAVLPTWDRWTYEAEVVSVYDADTVEIRLDVGFRIAFTDKIRVLGIQAPEVGGAGVTPEEKAAGFAARDRLRAILADAGNRVIVRTKKDAKEGRGRYLGTIYVRGTADPEAWIDVAGLLVLEGHAVPYDGRGRAPKWTPEGWRPAS